MQQVQIKVPIQNSFYVDSEQVFDHFRKYHLKILLGDFNVLLREKKFSTLQLGMTV